MHVRFGTPCIWVSSESTRSRPAKCLRIVIESSRVYFTYLYALASRAKSNGTKNLFNSQMLILVSLYLFDVLRFKWWGREYLKNTKEFCIRSDVSPVEMAWTWDRIESWWDYTWAVSYRQMFLRLPCRCT